MSNREYLRSMNITEDDAEKMISDAVFFLLVSDQKKSILKRADLIKHCDLGKKQKNLQDYVISQASRVLLDTFGINMVDLSKQNQYILTNKLTERCSVGELLHYSDKEAAQMGITFITLGLILMSNDKVTDEVLFKFYKLLGLYEEDKPKGGGGKASGSTIDPDTAELFEGDIKKFVNEVLVGKQHYLKKERVNTGDPEQEVYEYTWGERAEKEVKQSTVFKMVCDVFECEAKMFKEQMEKVKQREGLDDDFFTNN